MLLLSVFVVSVSGDMNADGDGREELATGSEACTASSYLAPPKRVGNTQRRRRWVADALENGLLLGLAAAHLLGLQVLVQQIESLLIGTGTTSDGEHALAGVIMRCLGDGDAGVGRLADLADLATAASDDTADHVRRDADVLGLHLFAILGVRWGRGPAGGIGARSSRKGRRRVTEVSAVTSAVVRASAHTTGGCATAVGQRDRTSTRLNPDGGVVEDSAVAALVVVDEALANLPDSLLDTAGRALDFDDALGGLGEHLLLCDHAYAGGILDLLDLQALATNDGAHLVVRDEQADGYRN